MKRTSGWWLLSSVKNQDYKIRCKKRPGGFFFLLYFESLKDLNTEKISSNFVIGLEGEIIQCVPTSEMAYASNSRNQDTVSIENCHPDETGKFNDSTYNSLVHLTAYLCDKFDLDPENGGVIRHYDVTGKDCPRYFVQNPDAWQQFLTDVADYMREYGAL